MGRVLHLFAPRAGDPERAERNRLQTRARGAIIFFDGVTTASSAAPWRSFALRRLQ
jgi:hypothetical protein